MSAKNISIKLTEIEAKTLVNLICFNRDPKVNPTVNKPEEKRALTNVQWKIYKAIHPEYDNLT